MRPEREREGRREVYCEEEEEEESMAAAEGSYREQTRSVFITAFRCFIKKS